MLRWIERDGKMTLQQLTKTDCVYGDLGEIWQDVPTHQEPKVDMLVEELANGFRNYAQIGKNYEWSLADYAVKFFRAKESKMKDQEPKKVSVEQELAEALWNCHWSLTDKATKPAAKTAIEFFKSRMPKLFGVVSHESEAYYNQALKDVRKSLFGDENA